MKIWIVTVGEYDDMAIVGVATSEHNARAILDKAATSKYWGDRFRDRHDIDGPYEADAAYGWGMNQL